jgi:hypothetical protein
LLGIEAEQFGETAMTAAQVKSNRMAPLATALVLMLTASIPAASLADEDIDKGPVWRTWTARVAEDKMDDYLNYLSNVYKHNLAAWKAAGLLTDYRILVTDPHGADDPNIFLMFQYKNMAGLDAPSALWAQASKQALDQIKDPEARKLIDVNYEEWRTYTGASTAREVNLK